MKVMFGSPKLIAVFPGLLAAALAGDCIARRHLAPVQPGMALADATSPAGGLNLAKPRLAFPIAVLKSFSTMAWWLAAPNSNLHPPRKT